MQISTKEHQECLQSQQVQVVPRREIPQDFDKHTLLKNFLPSLNKLAFSWIILKQNAKTAINTLAKATMLIVCHGEAKLVDGMSEKIIIAGDTVLIPSQSNYELHAIASEGLQAVLLQFPAKKAESLHKYALTYEGLIQHNAARMQLILKNPYFTLLSRDNNVLNDPEARQRFLDGIQVFSDFFQHILFIRQGTCQDSAYYKLFLQHLQEEFGHDELLAARNQKHRNHDSILHATSMWFCNQMLILDNLEKAALVHLVLEVSGAYYHDLAMKKLGTEAPEYYDVHMQVDDIHAQMGANLLAGHPAEVYRRLHNVIDKGWSMLDAMTRRVAQIVERSNKP